MLVPDHELVELVKTSKDLKLTEFFNVSCLRGSREHDPYEDFCIGLFFLPHGVVISFADLLFWCAYTRRIRCVTLYNTTNQQTDEKQNDPISRERMLCGDLAV